MSSMKSMWRSEDSTVGPVLDSLRQVKQGDSRGFTATSWWSRSGNVFLYSFAATPFLNSTFCCC